MPVAMAKFKGVALQPISQDSRLIAPVLGSLDGEMVAFDARDATGDRDGLSELA